MPAPSAHKQNSKGERALTQQVQTAEGLERVSHDTRPEIMLLHPSRWLTCHYKHLLSLQLGCKEPKKHKNANDKKTVKEAEKEAEEAEKPRKKPREQPRKL